MYLSSKLGYAFTCHIFRDSVCSRNFHVVPSFKRVSMFQGSQAVLKSIPMKHRSSIRPSGNSIFWNKNKSKVGLDFA